MKQGVFEDVRVGISDTMIENWLIGDWKSFTGRQEGKPEYNYEIKNENIKRMVDKLHYEGTDPERKKIIEYEQEYWRTFYASMGEDYRAMVYRLEKKEKALEESKKTIEESKKTIEEERKAKEEERKAKEAAQKAVEEKNKEIEELLKRLNNIQ